VAEPAGDPSSRVVRVPKVFPCPVCNTGMVPFDSAPVMGGRYQASYFRCAACGLVTTPETPWLEEAYASAIHLADSGLLRRARKMSRLATAVIRFEGIRDGRFLDWAGGYGVFTQLMRDRGLDFWHHDDFAKPIFADAYQDDGTAHCDLVTAFEVLEHLADPRRELAPIAARTDRILFTTELLPSPAPKVGEWWYYLPNVGQHITFHTPESLRILAGALGFQVTTNGRSWHLFHRGPADLRTRALLSGQAVDVAHGARGALARVKQRLR
jgi:hypothetical protein